MKPKILKLSVIVLLFTLTAKAQEYQYVPFPDSNAVWSEYYWSSNAPGVYNKYALFNEDTVINSITYNKLFHTENKSEITRENSVCIGGIREDSQKRVFASAAMFPIVPEIEEIMIYDFSLEVGDTIGEYINNDSIVTMFLCYLVVKDIDTILINNTKRKVFSFQYPWSRWIEGIGNVQGLIFPSGCITTGGDNSELICMHHNDTLMYFNEVYDGCVPQFVIDGVALLPNRDIKVYPNPVANSTVYFENLNFETLELFNINGQLVLKENIKGINSYKLNVLKLIPGTYSYRLKTQGLVPTRGKLIIQ